MSWISDVIEEVRNLDSSKKKLRKFGLTLDITFLIFSSWLLYLLEHLEKDF